MDLSLGTGQGGDTVYVADASGHEIKGKLAALSTATLTLQGGTTFLEHDVTQIRVERQAPPWRGALIGLAAVGGPWLAACAADDDWCDYGAKSARRTSSGRSQSSPPRPAQWSEDSSTIKERRSCFAARRDVPYW